MQGADDTADLHAAPDGKRVGGLADLELFKLAEIDREPVSELGERGSVAVAASCG